LFLVREYGSLKHGSSQRLAAGRPSNGVCREHFRYPCVGRRAGVLAARIYWRSYEHARSIFFRVPNHFPLRPGLALRREISSGGYSCGRNLWSDLNARPVLEVLMSIMRRVAIYFLMLIGVSAYAESVPDDCTQLILGITPTWDSTHGEVR